MNAPPALWGARDASAGAQVGVGGVPRLEGVGRVGGIPRLEGVGVGTCWCREVVGVGKRLKASGGGGVISLDQVVAGG